LSAEVADRIATHARNRFAPARRAPGRHRGDEEQRHLIIIGKDQRYTDMPEYRNSSNPDYMNERG
jgi:hypothetical protein